MSDSEFQQLDEIDIEDSICPDRLNNKNNTEQPKKPTIKKKLNIFKISITQSENKLDLNILQNQFYLIQLYEKEQLIRENVRRRYSDFDLLFQILQKKYPGFLFPAFPEKGILSYVKTKVSVTKDQQFLKKRIKIIQRFFNSVLNQQKFNPHKCTEIKKFFSPDEEYEIFKQTNRQELNQSKSIVDSTWGVIKDFFKMSQSNKYTVMAEQIKKQKVPFEELLLKTQDILALVNDQFEANRALCQYESQNLQKSAKFIPKLTNLTKKIESYTKLLQPAQKQICDLQFEVECENEDYLMILKKIEFIQQLKQSSENYKLVAAVESQFMDKKSEAEYEKAETLQKLKNRFRDIVNSINKIERSEK